MATDADADGFLSRWARRKALAREGVPAPAVPAAQPPMPPVPAVAPAGAVATPAQAPAGAAEPGPSAVDAPPPPTLEDVSALTPASDFTRFVARGVDPGVRNAALKKLFADPLFNVMDGLDTYIDDYGQPDPLPAAMLRKMAQGAFLNLFADDETAPGAVRATPPAPAEDTETLADEDPDLRLQRHDAAGPGGVDPGAEQDPGGER